MKPENKRKIRKFTERNEYLEDVQHIPGITLDILGE